MGQFGVLFRFLCIFPLFIIHECTCEWTLAEPLARAPSHPQLLLSEKSTYVSATRACPVMNTSRTDRCSVLLLVFVLRFPCLMSSLKLSLMQSGQGCKYTGSFPFFHSCSRRSSAQSALALSQGEYSLVIIRFQSISRHAG